MAQNRAKAFSRTGVALATLALLGSTAVTAQATESYGAAGDTIWLEQGWSPFDRDWYYYQTQGAEIIPYAFFLNLEQAYSEVLFRDDAHMNELGFTPMPPSTNNPDGLPMGFTKDSYGDVVGVNCAACHNGQVDYQGKRIIIDGGEPLIDFPGVPAASERSPTGYVGRRCKIRALRPEYAEGGLQTRQRDGASPRSRSRRGRTHGVR